MTIEYSLTFLQEMEKKRSMCFEGAGAGGVGEDLRGRFDTSQGYKPVLCLL